MNFEFFMAMVKDEAADRVYSGLITYEMACGLVDIFDGTGYEVDLITGLLESQYLNKMDIHETMGYIDLLLGTDKRLSSEEMKRFTDIYHRIGNYQSELFDRVFHAMEVVDKWKARSFVAAELLEYPEGMRSDSQVVNLLYLLKGSRKHINRLYREVTTPFLSDASDFAIQCFQQLSPLEQAIIQITFQISKNKKQVLYCNAFNIQNLCVTALSDAKRSYLKKQRR